MENNITKVTIGSEYQSVAQEGLRALTKSVDSLHEASCIFMQIPDKAWKEELKHFPKNLQKLANDCRTYGITGIDTRLLAMSGKFAMRARTLPDEDKRRVMKEGVECSIYATDDSFRRVGTEMIMPDKLSSLQMELCIEPKGRTNNFARLRNPAQQDKLKKDFLEKSKKIEQQQRSRVRRRAAYTMQSDGSVSFNEPIGNLTPELLISLLDDYKFMVKK